jgi:hypothetical protein
MSVNNASTSPSLAWRAGLGLGVDQVSVEGYVEHTVVSRHGPNVADDMLVVAE